MLYLLFYILHALYLTNPLPSLLFSDNMIVNNMTVDDDNNNGYKVDENEEPPNMAKTATAKKNKAAATALLKASAKTIGEDIISINIPLRKNQHAANWAAAYFLTTTLKGYRVYHYSKRSKNRIDVVFHKGVVPAKSAQPVMSLVQEGKAFRVEWKLSEHLFTDKQATAQAIPKDSVQYTEYADTLNCIH